MLFDPLFDLLTPRSNHLEIVWNHFGSSKKAAQVVTNASAVSATD